MDHLAGHGSEKYITGVRLGTGHGRGWEGLLAERWQHPAGDHGEVEPRDTEVIVLLHGRLRVRRRGDGRLQHHDAVPGTVWLCPAGIREDMIHLYGEVAESLHLYIPASPLSSTALRDLEVDPDKVALHYDGGFHDPLLEQMAWAIRAEMIDAVPAGKMLIETLAAAPRVHILRQHSNLEQTSTSLPTARGALDVRRLRWVTEFIDKSATGTAPHRYLIDRRIRHAEALVAEGRLPLAAIADICGFSSQAHLTRRFKQIVGTTPGVHRGR